ncbi:hypothetical protein KBI52_10855 [Microvirga sp. HBU67558]|uniref:hypothetical protein n=1 Tax=Microvirga sp. HBU67558 TaxID=2824562 RepID=UPI001B360614|nr:hypothetical protein [Microvirga sp. HBU67558]MBQ0820704.1 hypothetical protein [Microvirga sp. HBU67558]
MSVTTMPKVIHYDTLERFEEIDGLHLSLVKACGEEDGFLPGPPCLHLIMNAADGAYEPVFTIEPGHEDLARAIGQGMTLALSMARGEWECPPSAPMKTPKPECVVIQFPTNRNTRGTTPNER